jgi:cytochrome P450
MYLDTLPALSGASRLGHLRELRSDRLGLFRRFNRECGDIGRLRALGSSLVLVNAPELLREVLIDKAKSFEKPPGLLGPSRPLVGEGLFTSGGELWHCHRQLMVPAFAHAEIAQYAESMAECAWAAALELREDQTVDMAREMTRIAMRIAGKTLFDAETLDETDELGAALTFALRWIDEQTGSVPWALRLRIAPVLGGLARKLPDPLRGSCRALIEPIRWHGADDRKLAASLATIDRRVERIIAERRSVGPARPDLLNILLAAHDTHGGRMTDKQLRDEIVTLFIAGHETTATALAWSLFLICRHPEAYARVRAEAKGLEGRKPGADDLPKLAYCLQVFKEALRLYPPIYLLVREAATDVRVGDVNLPRGALVLISPWALHHRPELWPDPERFEPSRFEPVAEQSRHRQAYLPFGAGPRMCIGSHFAMVEGPIVLATILGRVDLDLAGPDSIEPETFATLRPKGGVPMRVLAVERAPQLPAVRAAPTGAKGSYP